MFGVETRKKEHIHPQEKQEAFISSKADVCLYGGGAGAGKTWAALFIPSAFLNIPGFRCIIFRRTNTQITAAGALWDAAFTMYSPKTDRNAAFQSKNSPPFEIKTSINSKIQIRGMQHEKDKYNYQGAEIPLVVFEEATQFETGQLLYLLGRNRIPTTLQDRIEKPLFRLTCNPDPDSVLRHMVVDGGYVDKATGFPLWEESGKIRYFQRIPGTDQFFWANSKEEIEKKFKDKTFCKSFTFIPAKLSDNAYVDPTYESSLSQLLPFEVARLLHCNWFARPTAGEVFSRTYFKIGLKAPKAFQTVVRCWDRAGTVKSEDNPDPDGTASVLLGLDFDNKYWVLDTNWDTLGPGDVETFILETANRDYRKYGDNYVILIGQDPGSAGKTEIYNFEKKLLKYNFVTFPITKSKLTIWKPAARFGKNTGFYILDNSKNLDFFLELEGVTDGTQRGHDDMTDCLSQAFLYLSEFGYVKSGQFSLGDML
jgi:phage terminase large subunit-like protein